MTQACRRAVRTTSGQHPDTHPDLQGGLGRAAASSQRSASPAWSSSAIVKTPRIAAAPKFMSFMGLRERPTCGVASRVTLHIVLTRPKKRS